MFDKKKIIFISLILLVIALPIILQEKNSSIIPISDAETIVIITPHNEAVRREYSTGFKKWYKQRTGKDVNIDWRYQGGGQDAARYIESMFANNFRLHWVESLKNVWTSRVAAAFSNRSEELLNPSGFGQHGENIERTVNAAFFESDIGCGVDILFGGGIFEFEIQAQKGNLVPCSVLSDHPEMFSESTIPQFLSGNRLWDKSGKWFGVSLSAFGIIYNSDAILQDGISIFPRTWMDLGLPEFFKKLAIVDPTKSSSILRAFVMLIQQQMQISYNRRKSDLGVQNLSKQDEILAIKTGWTEALQLLQRIVSNGRYFTDSATRPVIDVSAGNCLAGIAIDFYGLAEAKHLEERSGSRRFKFVMPQTGERESLSTTEISKSSQNLRISEIKQFDDRDFLEEQNGGIRFKFVMPHAGGAPIPDPIGIFRGAPNPSLATEFIKYVLSIDGQKLLDFNIHTPGGPEKTTMRRVPILKTIYEQQYNQYRCDPTINPYVSSAEFISRDEWTNKLFHAIGFIVKVAFIDLNDELSNAMSAIFSARNDGRIQSADEAYAKLSDMSLISYDNVISQINPVLDTKNTLAVVNLQNKITKHFRNQYLAAKRIAEGK